MKIDVMGKKIRVKRVKNLLKKKFIYGDFDSHKLVIRIDKSLKGDIFNKTLLHEVLHCILFLSGFNEFLTFKKEEVLVRLIENNFLDICKKFLLKDVSN